MLRDQQGVPLAHSTLSSVVLKPFLITHQHLFLFIPFQDFNLVLMDSVTLPFPLCSLSLFVLSILFLNNHLKISTLLGRVP